MATPVRIFISHSSDDAALTDAVVASLQQQPGLQVIVDRSGLEAGRPWQRQLHEFMARCSAGLVLLTPAVQARWKWVLKEAIILAWRLDLERDFRLMFALAPGLQRQAFLDLDFGLAQFAETQTLKTPAEPSHSAALAAEVAALLPASPAATPYDELVRTLGELLQIADPQGATFITIATHLGLQAPATYGPDKRAQLADAVARAIVCGRETQLAVDELVQKLNAWNGEHRHKLVRLLVPYWVEGEAAGRLLREAARPGGSAVSISSELVPEFTAAMYVRRAHELRTGAYRLAGAVGLMGGDLYDEIRHEICEQARKVRWALDRLPDDKVVDRLRTSPTPIFVPLAMVPDAADLQRLRQDFPRVVFLAPSAGQPAGAGLVELLPPPSKTLESGEFDGYERALNAIRNL